MTSRQQIAAHRLQRAQQAMAEQRLDALLMTGGTNLVYLSGFPYVDTNLARPYFLLVPRSSTPVLLVHTGRAYEARALSWIADIRTYEPLSAAPVGELAAIMRERDVFGARVGMELGFEQRLGLPSAELDRLRAELAPTLITDAAGLLWQLRMIKASWDIKAMRRACAITAEAYARTFAETRGGEPERDVMLRMTYHTMRLDGGSPWVAITSGTGNYDVVMGNGTDRTLQQGDMVWMDSGCTVDNLWSDYGRAGVIGGASPEQAEGQRLLREIVDEGVAMVAPGARTSDIAKRLNDRVNNLTLPVTSHISTIAGRVGHGIGLDLTEPPHLSEYDHTVLQPGMVISIEPGVATEYGIFHIEEDVIVTRDGHEVISVAPWQLKELQA
jgi:Xaa-Pro aminopeptidase